jgi:anti-sigma factor RsiW
MNRDDDPIEGALDEALARHLPRHRPSAAFERHLRERLVAAAAPAREPGARHGRSWRGFLAPFAGGLAAALVAIVLRLGAPRAPVAEAWSLVDEAVSDHLRVVASTRPPEIESGGIHQVKPWFTGRVDFAPRVAFAGDADFPLVGGSLGYVRDRKAAVFEYRRRLHAITLLVFPAADLPWPRGAAPLAGLDVVSQSSRGFTVLLWRDADLGYALVSDVARAELETLVGKISPSP